MNRPSDVAITVTAALNEPNVKAFLRVLRAGETSQDDSAYYTQVFGARLQSLADHPRQVIKGRIGGKTVPSSAAGAYQFLRGTWDECAAALGLRDFGPASQDLAAVFLIRRRGALQDVIDGRFEEAVRKCAREWASLPGSPYGQPVKTMAQARAVYEQYGGSYTTVADAPTPEPQEAEMPAPLVAALAGPFLSAAATAIAAAVPRLGELFGGESPVAKRNVEAATIAVGVVRDALGARNEQEIVEAIEQRPAEVVPVIAAAIEENWFQLHEASEKSIAQARQFAVSYAQQKDLRTVVGNLTFIELLSLIMLLSSLLGGVLMVLYGGLNDQLKGAIVMLMLVGGYTGVKEFWLGSSHGSKTKDDSSGSRPG